MMSKVKEVEGFYAFGDFRLDARGRELTRAGEALRLEPIDLKVLLALVGRAGEILDREFFRQAVWQGSSVTENSLSQSVSRLRRALGDSRSDPRFIETVQKRGYRFVADVEKHDWVGEASPGRENGGGAPDGGRAVDDATSLQTEKEGLHPQPETRTRRLPGLFRAGKRTLWGAAVAVAVLLLFGAGLIYTTLKRDRPGNRAAVLPGKSVLKLTHDGKTGNGAISPDGRYLAYEPADPDGRWSVRLRDLETNAETQLLPPSEKGYGGLVFSPDSRTLYFTGPGDANVDDFLQSPLYKVPVSGGKTQRVAIGVNSPVTLSPDGRRIAFIRRNPTLKEASLILANEDGGGEQVLATAKWPTVFYFPSWSPDGRRIAMGQRSLDDRGYYAGAVAVRVEGGEVEALTTRRWEGLTAVRWLGDGSGILALASDRPGQPVQVWEISYPGGSARNVTEDSNDYAYYNLSVTADSRRMVLVENTVVSDLWVTPQGELGPPRQLPASNGAGFRGVSWTPDGKILYTSRSPDSWDIWEADADGGGRTRLTVNAGNNYYPSASRDGRHIIFTSDRGGHFNVWRMDRDGGNPVRLTEGVFDDFPCFTPDGKWVIYRSTDRDNRKLWKVPAAGGESVQLTDRYTYPPAVSPDGRYIAAFYTLGALRGLAVIPVDGGEPVKTFDVLPNPTDPDNPFSQVIRWTPDGSAVSYMDHQRGTSNVWSQPLAGGPPRQVTHFAAEKVFFFDWSADGRRLALSRGKRIEDVVLVSDFR